MTVEPANSELWIINMMLAVLLTYVPQDTTITGIAHHITDVHNPVTTEAECIRSYIWAKFMNTIVNISCQHMVVHNKTKYDILAVNL
jgi:hypothetical protein